MFVFYVVFRKHKFRAKALVLGISLLLLLTNPFFATTSFSSWEIDPIPLSKLSKHDIAVVFSGMTNSERKPYDRIYFNKASDRIMMAVHLYKIGKVHKILISGGIGTLSGNGRKEAETLKEFLLMLGIPEKDIIQEKEANNTYQNALYTKQIVDEQYHNSKIILITSAFHMRRSYGCASKVGLVCTPFAVDYYTKTKIHSLQDFIIPNGSSLNKWDILFHEWLGYLMYVVTGKI